MTQHIVLALGKTLNAAISAGTKQHAGHMCGLIPVFVIATSCLILCTSLIGHSHNATVPVMVSACSLWFTVSALVLYGLRYHPFRVFGLANQVTALRALLTCLLAGLVPVAQALHGASSDLWMWLITGLVLTALLMDGLDGYLARKSGLQSAFGARFDMETDALLALVIALFLWQSQKTGIWVLSLGLMRYAFIVASIRVVALQAELYPSLRRKTVCVIQISALCALLSPWIEAPFTIMIGACAVIALGGSFIRDIQWLLKQQQS